MINRMKNVALKNIHWTIPGWKKIQLKNVQWKKKYWIGVAALVLLAVAGFSIYGINASQRAAASAATSQLQTSVARQGDLTIYASGAGEVIPSTEISVGFDESGTLIEFLVTVGEEVQAGQLLARLQTERTEEEVALAIAEADLAVLTAQQALDEIYANAQADAAAALQAVEEAQKNLDDLNNSQLIAAEALQAVTEAEEAVKTAYSSYNGTRSTADDNTIDYYYAELVIAQANLRDAKLAFKEYAEVPDTNLEKANMQLKLSVAQQAYDSAMRYYNAATGTGSEIDLATTAADVAVAEATQADAQRQYERLKDGPTPGEIAVAEAELALAKAEYETLKNGADPAEVALAEATLANAQAQLEVAKENQAVIELLAPISGTILAIDGNVGETVSSGQMITLADLSQPVLDVYLDESDMDSVGIGYEVEVVFDSLPDAIYSGHVTAVDPSLQTVSNVDTVVIQVELDTDSLTASLSLPVGSNATVDVIGGRALNAVLVPVEAVREIATGEYAVFVMEDGEPRLRVVTVELMDYTTAAISSGLEPGDVVTTGVVETTQSDS
jgi:multidrug efflux pump subunit AcrA (membrane-fusion protein)